ncbi:MAG: ArsA family ATPase [Bdellovibrionales bacterium]
MEKSYFQHKSIHFVTGKGGVGKSTVAGALAMRLAEEKKALMVEIGDDAYLGESFSVNPNMMEQKVSENLFISKWSGLGCLSEYVEHLIKLKGVTKVFFDNPVMAKLLEIAPGLLELALLGKLTSKHRQIGPAIGVDEIVLDSFSTGHSMAMLRAPFEMKSAIKIGQMHQQSKTICETLESEDLTQFYIVTIPERVPLEETLELAEDMNAEFGISPKVIINKYLDYNMSELPELSNGFERFLYNKIDEQKFVEKEIQANKLEILKSPLILNTNSSIGVMSEIGKYWEIKNN